MTNVHDLTNAEMRERLELLRDIARIEEECNLGDLDLLRQMVDYEDRHQAADLTNDELKERLELLERIDEETPAEDDSWEDNAWTVRRRGGIHQGTQHSTEGERS
jgi:hypothetical protein